MILASTGWLSLFLSRNYELLSYLHLYCHGSVYGFLSLYTYLFVYFLGRRCMFMTYAYETGLLFPLWNYNIHVLVLLMALTWMIQKVDNIFIYCLNWLRKNLKILCLDWGSYVYSFEQNLHFDAAGLFLCYPSSKIM